MPETKPTATSSSHSAYWRESTYPLPSLMFIAPLLIFYEAGIVLLGPQAIRNAADVWMRQLLEALGFGQHLLLPLLTCALLLAWHHLSGRNWRFDGRYLLGMLAESLAFGLLLVTIAGLQGRLLANATAASSSDVLATLVAYVGAGIYEEVLFRLMLLPVAWWILKQLGFSPRASLTLAVLVTSVIFSAAHYQFELSFFGYRWGLETGEPFAWFSFLFRFLAGSFFSLLLLFRGFGITAGTHVMYDFFTLVV